jgi:MYXO-CTERM domain-containing protein
MNRLIARPATLALAAFLISSGAAAEAPDVIRITDGMNAGPMGQNDGPGAEQPTVVHSLVDGDGDGVAESRYLTTVWMSSQLEGSAVPRGDGNNNTAPYQCKCATYKIDPVLGPELVVAPRFVTQNVGNRPCNHPHMALNPVTNQILLAYGTNDPNQGNVSPYVQGLDVMCNALPVTFGTDGNGPWAGPSQRDREQKRLRIDNPNQGANDGAPWVALVNGTTGLWQVGYLENNNKSRTVGVTLSADGQHQLARQFDTIVVNEAERGRPSVARVSDTRTLVCSSDGLGRPPVNGVACGLIDAVTGQRLWTQRIAQAQPDATPAVYFNQPIIVQGENGRFYVQVERTNGGGNRNGGQQGRDQNRTRGGSHNMIYTLLPDDEGAHIQTDATVDGIGVNQVHATACSGKYGPQGAWHVAVFDASITGSGVAAVALARYDIAQGQLVRLARNQILGGYNADSGYLANLYGQNPNDQGRDYLRCIGDVPNPGFGIEGGYMPDVKTFFAFPYTGRVGDEPKNSLFLSLMPGEVPPPPVIPNYSVVVNVAGEGIGQVFSSPAGINLCADRCTHEWADATTVILTAIPAPGSAFTGWSGTACSGTGACLFSLDADVDVTATFDLLPVDPNDQVGLIVNVTGNGGGQVTSSPVGLDCETGTCARNFPRNSVITLTATPKQGSLFGGWSGVDGCADTGSQCTLTLTAARTVTATFSVDPNASADDDEPPASTGPAASAAGCGSCSGTGSMGDVAALALVMVGLLGFRRRREACGARTFRSDVVLSGIVGAVGLTGSCAEEPPQPVIDVFIPVEDAVAAGTPVELQYTVRDAEGVTIGMVGGAEILPFNTQATGSVFSPPLIQSSTFLLTAFQGELVATKTISVRVGGLAAEGEGEGEDAAPSQAAVIAFAPAATTIEDGASTTLSWTTAGARTGIILANDAVLQTIPAADLESGSATVTPTRSTIYTLTVAGINGLSTTKTTSVNVTPPGVTINARTIFDANVKGVLQAKCGACHQTSGSPDLLGAGPDSYYDTLVGNPTMVPALPENSLLLVKGEHAGPAFTASESQIVTQWLLAEADERNLGGGAPAGPLGTYAPRNLSDALTRFGACMQRATWDTTYGVNTGTQVARQGSDQGQCMGCHTSGTGGAFLSASSGDTFEMHRLRPYVLKLVLSQANEDGSFKDLVPAKRHERRGGEGGDHPAYQLTPERIQAIDSFVDQTLARYHDYELDCATNP